MSAPAIRAENLGKMYRIGQKTGGRQTFRDVLSQAALSPFRKAGRLLRGEATGAAGLNEEMWALRDLSFEIQPGEVVGLVGRNGAGKSTLLKILSRITEPTHGFAEIHGRLGSLLEVGSGFHSELTGRENIFLNGAILGMRKQEIEKKFDEIVAFSEVERFIDTPVKHYSSGMAMRLAFAVAAHLETEILLVDEVLAVGDAAFQKKCLGKMGSVAEEGRTVLMVSHNLGAVADLCESAFWLEGGSLRSQGPAQDVIREYLRSYGTSEARWERSESDRRRGSLNFLEVHVSSESGEPVNVIDFDKGFHIEITYRVNRPIRGHRVFALLTNDQGYNVLETAEWDAGVHPDEACEPGIYRSVCKVPGSLLKQGVYYLSFSARQRGVAALESETEALSFEVSSPNRVGFHHRQGIITPILDWSVERIERPE